MDPEFSSSKVLGTGSSFCPPSEGRTFFCPPPPVAGKLFLSASYPSGAPSCQSSNNVWGTHGSLPSLSHLIFFKVIIEFVAVSLLFCFGFLAGRHVGS